MKDKQDETFVICRCGRRGNQIDVTVDRATGTCYYTCPCGRHWRLNRAGYEDRALGLMMEDSEVLGSNWTKQPAPSYLSKTEIP